MSSRSSPDQRSHVELSTIYEISRGLCASLDIRHSFHAALSVLAAQLGLHRLMVVLPDADHEHLRVHSAVGLSSHQMQQGQWRVDEGVEGQVYHSGVPAALPDVSRVPEFVDRTGAFGAAGSPAGMVVSYVAVPLRAEQVVLGVLAARRELESHERLSDDQRLLTMVASLLAQALLLHQVVDSEQRRLQQESTQLRKALYRERQMRFTLDQVIGASKPMQQVFAEVHKAAPARATVLLRGESGTGKEVIARAVHGLSARKDGPFVAVNCAAIAETLLESELFGHERGAFTGAIGERKGRFEQAHRGTLFLDEIGDISASFQAKLLRVLQEREFERVGGNRPVQVDVRLICATNRDLERMVERGEYRADLYYRINVIPIFVPPLRDRRADIPALVDHFIGRFNADNVRRLRISPEAMQILQRCQWPGNVRELQNCIERSATMTRGEVVRAADVACQHNRCLTKTLNHFEVAPPAMAPQAETGAPGNPARPTGSAHEPEVMPPAPAAAPTPPAQGEAEPPRSERERLVWVMAQCGWVQAKAARMLNVTPRQLNYALKKHGITLRKL